MNLRDLLKNIPTLDTHADGGMTITGVSCDSNTVTEGSLFAAIPGCREDGHGYIPAAIGKGAVCVLCERPPAEEIPYILVEDTRAALSTLAKNWYGDPAESLTLIGVTGTNGKTTTAHLLKTVLETAGHHKVGLIGTGECWIGSKRYTLEGTTPEPLTLYRVLRRMADALCTHVVMEVSSHALSMDRVKDISFAVGIFTNLTRDHLDFHPAMEDYAAAKAKLFTQCAAGVYNGDDPWAAAITENASCPLTSFGLGPERSLHAENVTLLADGAAFTAVAGEERTAVRLGIPGEFNVYNALGVLAAAKALGIGLAAAAAALAAADGVKGRMEVVPTDTDYTVIIDYAHTPDALEKALTALKAVTPGRVLLVFGCGGDRDQTKRPLMGAVAARLADAAIITTDNPRTENPSAIVADIIDGMIGSDIPYTVMESRAEAIRFALNNARTGDAVLLAGKGHETYQIVGKEKLPFDERQVVSEYFEEFDRII